MQDPASELPRIPLPRTPLNKGMAPLQSGRNRLREDECFAGYYAPAEMGCATRRLMALDGPRE